MGGRKFFVTGLAVLLVVLMSLPVYAGLYSGQVTSAPTNDYGIVSGDSVTLDYDLGSRSFSVLFDTGPVSDPLFYAYFTQDDVYGTLDMEGDSDGQLTNLEFTTQPIDETIGPLAVLEIKAGDPINPSALGTIGYDLVGDDWGISGTLTYTAIPIPGAIWLLGSGMIGLAGIRRRFGTLE